jgi:hypothetical protein
VAVESEHQGAAELVFLEEMRESVRGKQEQIYEVRASIDVTLKVQDCTTLQVPQTRMRHITVQCSMRGFGRTKISEMATYPARREEAVTSYITGSHAAFVDEDERQGQQQCCSAADLD